MFRAKRERRRKKKSLRTQILLGNAEAVEQARNIAEAKSQSDEGLDKENQQPKKKRKIVQQPTEKRRKVTEVKPFSFTLREERKKKEKEGNKACSEDDDDDICFKMPMRPQGGGVRKRQVASLSRLNQLAKPKMQKSVRDSSLPKPMAALPKPKDKSKIEKILAKPKALIRTAKEPTKAISPKFNLARRFTERKKREEILAKERKKQEEENKKIKEREDRMEEKQLKVGSLHCFIVILQIINLFVGFPTKTGS